MAPQTETRVSPWVSTAGRPAWDDSDIAAYRVWTQFDGLRWFQRHEWERKDGSIVLDGWINSGRGFEPHLIPVASDAREAA